MNGFRPGLGMRMRHSQTALALLIAFGATTIAGTAAATDPAATAEDRIALLEARIKALESRLATTGTTTEALPVVVPASSLTSVSVPVPVSAPVPTDHGKPLIFGDTRFTLSGYVKLDMISARTSGGQLLDNAITRDFLIPGTIPVGDRASGWDSDFSARQTRIILGSSTPIGGKMLTSHVELDFMVTDGGDERASNSYVPRMRQAFLTYDGWLFGQAWTTFQNVSALPDSVDFVGTTPGTVFVRQPMVRYRSKGGVSVAVEQPETTLTLANGARMMPGDDQMPDIVVRYDSGPISVSAIGRQLNASEGSVPLGHGDSALGYGVSVAGKLPVGHSGDDLRFMVTAGRGIGRYMGINIVNDAAIAADGSLRPIETFAGFAAYRHLWSDRLRSTLAGSYFKAGNPVLLTGGSQTDALWNSFINLIYAPIPKLDLGVEYMFAKRTLESGAHGNLQKVQMAAKYSF